MSNAAASLLRRRTRFPVAAALLVAQMAAGAGEMTLYPTRLGLPAVQVERLQAALERGRWVQAESVLFRALPSSPANPQLHRALGIVHYQAGRYFLAGAALKRADALAPLDRATRFMLASAFMRAERPHWARAELERLNAQHPDEPRSRHLLARIHYEQQRLDAALEELDQAIRAAPDFSEAHDLRGQCLEGLARPDDAAAAYRQAIALEEGEREPSPWPHYHLGSLLHDFGHLRGAETALASAIKLDPQHAPAHWELGIVLRKLDKPSSAAEALESAARLSPADARIQYSLVGVYRELGDRKRLAAALQRYQELADGADGRVASE